MDFRGYFYSDLDKDFKVINQSGFEFNQSIRGSYLNKSSYVLPKCIFRKTSKSKLKKK